MDGSSSTPLTTGLSSMQPPEYSASDVALSELEDYNATGFDASANATTNQTETDQFDEHSLSTIVGLSTVYAMITVIALTGNVVVIWIIGTYASYSGSIYGRLTLTPSVCLESSVMRQGEASTNKLLLLI